MFFHIIRKDLKRKKTMNIIVLLFIVLSAMFASSSVNNIVTVMGGIDHFMDISGIGDVDMFYLTTEKNNGDTLMPTLKAAPSVTKIEKENVFYLHASDILLNGKKAMDFSNIALIQRVGEASINYFDSDNNIIETVPEGGVYITGPNPDNAGLEKGDMLDVTLGDMTVRLEFLGRGKDAMLGSNFLTNPRLLVSDKLYNEFAADESTKFLRGGVYYVESDDTKALAEAASENTSIVFDGTSSVIRTTYIMEVLVAALLLIISVILILVAFIVLRFTIGFTIAEEFREIGVMKAIGLKSGSVRKLYLVKYLGLAAVGSAVGYFLSIPFGRLMLSSAEQSIVLGNDSQVMIGLLAAAAVVLIIMLFCYGCTRKIKKLSPIDAVRSGQTGERFHRHSFLKLGRSRLSTSGFLSANDVISQPKQFGIMTVIFTLCILLVMILANTANTLASDKLVMTLSVTKSDLYYNRSDMLMKIMGGDDYDKYIAECEKKLADAGIPGKIKNENTFKVSGETKKLKRNISAMWCARTDTSDYVYEEGTPPKNAHEIAATQQICDLFGIDIGDKISLTINGKTEEYLVTAKFQSMNQLGEVIRLHQDVEMDYSSSSNGFSFQIDFDDHPDAETIESRKDTVKELMQADSVKNVGEFVDECTNSSGPIKAVKDLVLIIAMVMIAMLTVLMERSFITREKAEIALMKALGFRDRNIMLHHTLRFLTVGVLAGLISAALCMPLTKLAIDPIFGIMGATKGVEYSIHPLEVFGLYPIMIIAVIEVSALLTSLLTKRVSSSDTADIE